MICVEFHFDLVSQVQILNLISDFMFKYESNKQAVKKQQRRSEVSTLASSECYSHVGGLREL